MEITNLASLKVKDKSRWLIIHTGTNSLIRCGIHLELQKDQVVCMCNTSDDCQRTNFDVLLTVHLSIYILVINQLDVQNFCLQ